MNLLRSLYREIFRPKIPDNVEPTDDVAQLRQWVDLPAPPSGVRWRGVGQASSGRVGALWYEVHALLRFDEGWTEVTRALEALPRYRGGPGTQHWHEFLPKEVMPLVEGPTHARGPYFATSAWWRHPTWACSGNAWANTLGEGPWILACWSTVSVPS
jgi:hypothetical protein